MSSLIYLILFSYSAHASNRVELLIGDQPLTLSDDDTSQVRLQDNSWGMQCRVFDFASLGFASNETAQITGWDPIISKPNGAGEYGIVHHMNVFGCPMPAEGMDCNDMYYKCGILASYDKGAEPFNLPQDIGIDIGPGVQKAIVLQIHYLLPANREQPGKFQDNSGFALKVSRVPDRTRDRAAMLPIMDMSMRIDADQSKERKWSFPTVVGEDSDDFTSHSLDQDFTNFGALNVRAIHYHMHDMGTSMKIEHSRDGKMLQQWNVDQYKGYGPNQTFVPVATTIPIQKGDLLNTTCSYKAGRTISYGVGHDDEMCAPLIIYSLHKPQLRDDKVIPTGRPIGKVDIMPTAPPIRQLEEERSSVFI